MPSFRIAGNPRCLKKTHSFPYISMFHWLTPPFFMVNSVNSIGFFGTKRARQSCYMNSSVQLLLVQPSVGVRHEIWCVPPIYSNLNGKNAAFFVFLINHGMECFFNKPVVFSMWEFGDASPSWSIVSGLRPPISFFFCKKLLLHTSLTCFSGAWPVMWKLKVVSFVRCYIYIHTYVYIYVYMHV